jgi:hypothetical protein
VPVAEKPQHLQALARANECRLKRATLKREVKAGECSLAELFSGRIPVWLRNMLVEELLTSARRFPRKTAYKVIRKAGASLTVTVGGLTARQRAVVAAELAEWEAKRS